MAYGHGWLSDLFGSNAALQRGCGADWMSVATLAGLVSSMPHLAGLAALPGLSVALMTIGTVSWIVIRLGVAELVVQAVDRRGLVHVNSQALDFERINRLLVSDVTVRGASIKVSQSA